MIYLILIAGWIGTFFCHRMALNNSRKAYMLMVEAAEQYLEFNRDSLVDTLKMVENPQAQEQLGGLIGVANNLLAGHEEIFNKGASQ